MITSLPTSNPAQAILTHCSGGVQLFPAMRRSASGRRLLVVTRHTSIYPRTRAMSLVSLRETLGIRGLRHSRFTRAGKGRMADSRRAPRAPVRNESGPVYPYPAARPFLSEIWLGQSRSSSLHFSPPGVTSCVRGASVRGAFGLTPTPLNQRHILDGRSKTVGKCKEGMAGLSPASPVRR